MAHRAGYAPTAYAATVDLNRRCEEEKASLVELRAGIAKLQRLTTKRLQLAAELEQARVAVQRQERELLRSGEGDKPSALERSCAAVLIEKEEELRQCEEKRKKAERSRAAALEDVAALRARRDELLTEEIDSSSRTKRRRVDAVAGKALQLAAIALQDIFEARRRGEAAIVRALQTQDGE